MSRGTEPRDGGNMKNNDTLCSPETVADDGANGGLCKDKPVGGSPPPVKLRGGRR